MRPGSAGTISTRGRMRCRSACILPSWTGQTAAAWIDSYQRPEPFFLKVSFARPHSPYDPPERIWRRYQDAGAAAGGGGALGHRALRRGAGRESDAWHGDLGADQVRRSRQGYYGSVTFVDEQIGRILEALTRRRLMEQTLIVFFSDHGDMMGDHHLWRKSYAVRGFGARADDWCAGRKAC